MKRPSLIALLFGLTAFLLAVLFFAAINLGSLRVSPRELFDGLFVAYDPDVAAIYDLRFPRVLIALLAGGGIAVSGALLQAVLRNPVADPSLIGTSSGAVFAVSLVTGLFPMLYFSAPLFAICGGVLSFAVVYLLSWRGGLAPIRVILVGIAVNAVLVGLTEGIAAFSQGSVTTAGSVSPFGASASLALKTWDDVRLLALYVAIGLVAALALARLCNVLALEDSTIRSLGINVDLVRVLISFVAVVLASVTAAVVGVIAFLGLVVPHIARLLVGSDHRYLLPYCVLSGAFTLLLADTIGRLIAYPHEISAAILMAVIGGPLFIALLKRSGSYYG
jgi:iron complex transport system permease protein